MSDDFEVEDEFINDMDDINWDDPTGGTPEGERTPVGRVLNGGLEGAIGSATDNQMIQSRIRDALPNSLAENWETADQLIDTATKAKDNLVNPIRKEMVSFKRSINKLTPVVTKYLGGNVGAKFGEYTATRAQGEEVDPNTQELTNALTGIFNEDAEAKINAENKKLVIDMLERQTVEDRFKLQLTTIHQAVSSLNRMDEYNRTVTYNFQRKSLEYDIKRFHILKQILDVNKTGSEKSIAHLEAIVRNSSLPELVKQQNSELFQQMFVEKWYGDTLDNVMGLGRGMMRNFGKNIATRASNTAGSVVDAMRQAGDMAELVGDITDSGMEDDEATQVDPKQAIIDALSRTGGSGAVKLALDKIIATTAVGIKDKDWAKNILAQSDNIAQNKNLFFKTFIDDQANANEGMGKWLAPIFKMLQEDMPSLRRDMSSIGALNSFKPTDPRQWDQAQRTTVVDIIPGWLERIHNLINEILGRSNAIGYDDKSGGYIEKDEIKRGILDKITTDEERTDAISEIDKLIDYLTKDGNKAEGDTRQLLREWMIREASTTSDLDIRRLMDADSFKDLNTYDETIANNISANFNGLYDDKSLFRLTRDGLGDIDGNNHLRSIRSRFNKVNRHYKDDQEVLNESITGGRRGLLSELGLLNSDGSINELAILKHKLLGVSPTTDQNINDSSLRDLAPLIDPPTPDVSDITSVPPTPIVDTSTPSAGFDSDNFSGTPPDTTDSAPVDLMPYKDILEAIASDLTGIRTNTNDVVSKLKDMTGSAATLPFSIAIPRAGVGDLTVTNTHLSGILSILATMHEANISYYSNVRDFEADRHGINDKVKSLLGKGWDNLSKMFDTGRTAFGKLFNVGNISVGAIKEGFNSRFKFGAADVYVGEETTPRILAHHFRTRHMFLRIHGEVSPEQLRTPDDIVGEVVDENQEVIISQSEYDDGLVRVNREGIMKRIGGVFGSLTKMGFNALDGSFNIGSSAFNFAKATGNTVFESAKHHLFKFRDAYYIDGDGRIKLLASARELIDGKLLYELDGEYHVVKDMADLLKGNIYRRGEDGLPEVVATIGDMRRGLVDVTGKVIETAGGLFGSTSNLIRNGIDGAIGLAKVPFAILGNTWGAIKSKFESKLLDKIVLNIPKDVLINANVVYLNDTSKEGKKRRNRRNGRKGYSTTDTTVDRSPTVAETAKASVKEAADKARDKYDSLSKNKRVKRAKAQFRKAAKQPEVLRKMLDDSYDEHVMSTPEPLSKKDFIAKYAKDRLGDGWEKVTKEMDAKLDGKSVKETIIDKADENPTFKALREKLTGITDSGYKLNAKDILNRTGLSKFLPKGDSDTTASEYNDAHEKLVRYGSKDTADAYFDKLKDDPATLRDVAEDAWRRHVKNNLNPVPKDEFIDQWLYDKFKNDAPSVLEDINELDALDVTDSTKGHKSVIDTLKGSRLGRKLSDINVKLKDTTKEEREEVATRFGGDGTTGGLDPMMDFFRKKFKKSDDKDKPVNDGKTESPHSAWRKAQQLARDKYRARKDAKEANKGNPSGGDSDNGDKGFLGLILAGLGTLVSGSFGIIKAVTGLGGTLVGFGTKMLSGITKGLWDVGKYLMGGIIKNGIASSKFLNKKLGGLVTSGINKAKPFVAAAATALRKKGASIALKVGTAVATRLAPALLAASNPIGWVVGAAAATYTAWQVSTSLYGIVDRRRDIKVMEYLRHLEYGMVSGNNGPQHLNKISLRYFEEKIISEAVVKDGLVEIGLTPNEVWREFRGDFEDDGDDANAPSFKRWYEGRFLPVLHKWMTLCHTFNDAHLAQQKEPLFGDKDNLALTELDDGTSREVKAGIAKQSLVYSHLEHDPLEIMDSPSTAVVCSARRVDAEAFCAKLMEHLNPKKTTANKPTNPKKGKPIMVPSKTGYGLVPESTKDEGYTYGTKPPSGINVTETTETPTTSTLNKNDDGGYTLSSVDTSDMVDTGYLDFIKRKEGFSPTAYWDVSQYSIGYGTRTQRQAETHRRKPITKQEAEKRLIAYTDKDREYIIAKGKEKGLTWSEGELDALTSFTYNLGRGNLGKLLAGRSKEEIAETMPRYSRVEKVVVPSLVKRRHEEVEMFRSGPPAANDGEIDTASTKNTLNKSIVTPPTKLGPVVPPKTPRVSSVDKDVDMATVAKTAPAPISQDVNVSLSDMPSNAGLESVMGNTNDIAGQALFEQRRSNDAIEALIANLTDTRTPETTRNHNVRTPVTPINKSAPIDTPVINSTALYKS